MPCCKRRSIHNILSAIALTTIQSSLSFGFQIPSAVRQLFAFQPPTPSTTTITTTTTTSNDNVGGGGAVANVKGKRIVFIRHGRTYMNEYLGQPGCHFGAPNFSDVFAGDDELDPKYRDTLLNSQGIIQAQDLAKRLEHNHKPLVLRQLDLVVVSPLTRALQTMEHGLLPFLLSAHADDDDDDVVVVDNNKDAERGRQHSSTKIPIVALPYAAERLYLISDIGTPRSKLKAKFPYVDFDSGFDSIRNVYDDDDNNNNPWWFTKEQYERGGTFQNKYVEWRPNTAGQRYACPGEPEHVFEQRMIKLYQWLEARPESTIAVVSHWGVIRWMLNVDFGNCEMRVVPFDKIRPRALFAIGKRLF